jgi:hypothetical protein
METAWPICPQTISFESIVIYTGDNDNRRRGFREEKLVGNPQIDAVEWLDQ